ncbi:MAG: hypothetical protein ACJA2O_003992 [Candidatus Azotimanducaceae bacterium]|jgi:hypothetical protein
MSGDQSLERMLASSEVLQKDLLRFISQSREFVVKLKASVNRLEKDGLPREMVKKFREKHVTEITRYLNGLTEFLEKDTLKYTKEVQLALEESLRIVKSN